jgi:hypothetical protein
MSLFQQLSATNRFLVRGRTLCPLLSLSARTPPGLNLCRSSASCWSLYELLGSILFLAGLLCLFPHQTPGIRYLLWTSFFFNLFFLIRYFLHLHFKCYPKSPPDPPHPIPLPTHSHFLALAFPHTEAYKVCKTKGPLFPLMAD